MADGSPLGRDDMLLNLLEVLLVTAGCAAVSLHFLHMLQLESYQLDGYLRWLNKNPERARTRFAAVGVVLTALYWYLPIFLSIFTADADLRYTISRVLLMVVFAIAAAVIVLGQHRQPAKKPLVFTARMKRLFAGLCGVCFLLTGAVRLIGLPVYLAFAAGAYLTLVAGFAMQPVENRINRGFFEAAKAKLEARPDLIKIGITGSYGKTSTKFALMTILSEKYNVLASPASFNTPMGLSRVVNTQLNDKHQVFIAEMGARHVGDIRELVDLVHPKYGLLTSVGPQHLETFQTVENIANTKYELIDGLPDDGTAFFADDGNLVHQLYDRCPVRKVLTGIGDLGQELRAENLRVTINGSKFDLVTADGQRKPCTTRLLGRHNIANIVLAASVALELGLTLDEIGAGIRKIAPVEHRLQLIKGAMTVIDDAFNSNPSGAEEALNVLGGFPQNRIIVTPGFVEQGKREAELNFQFGAQMVGKVDIAILVGKKHSKPIHDGLSVAGFDESHIYVVPNLDEASVALRQIGKAGDTVLFENDLPDNYNE